MQLGTIHGSLLALALTACSACSSPFTDESSAAAQTATASRPDAQPSPAPSACDQVYGSCVAPGDSYSVRNGHIFDHGKQIALHGINWFGFEGSYLGLHGLWTGRSMRSFVDQMQGLGFNAFRIPLSPEVLDTTRHGMDGYDSPLDELKALLVYTQSKGMYVLLDLHVCSASNDSTNKPGPGKGDGCSKYTVDDWHSDLETLAQIAVYNPNVVGIDLFNEPYGFGWSEWSSAASAAGQVVLQANPKILVFVEGVGNNSDNAGNGAFWGENLTEASALPPTIPASRLVLSPHVYGPSVSDSSYFHVPNFPANMPSIWDPHYGYLPGKGYTLAIGEFGGRMDAADKPLQVALVQYLIHKNIENFFFWSMNPNSGDTGGLLKDDWTTVDTNKLQVIRPLFCPYCE